MHLSYCLLTKPACSSPCYPYPRSSRSCSAWRLRLRRGSGTPSCSFRTVPATWWRRGGATGSSRSWRPYETVRLAPHSRLRPSLTHGALRLTGKRSACAGELLVQLEFSLFFVGELAVTFDIFQTLVDVHISLAELLMDNRYDTCRLCTFLIGLLFLLFREWNHIYLTLIWRILNKLA